MRNRFLLLCGFLCVYGSCAKVECQLNSDCGERARCEANVCVRDCLEDRDCPTGSVCEPNGRCVERDAGGGGVEDAGGTFDTGGVDSGAPPEDRGTTVVDTGIPPVDTGNPAVVDTGNAPIDTGNPTVDIGVLDTGIDTGPTFVDTGNPVADTGPRDTGIDVGIDTGPRDTGIDVGFDTGPRDTGSIPDVGQGPVPVGFYEFTGVRPGTLINPVAAAWHPSGQWALILGYTDEVHLYDATATPPTLTRVAMAGRTVYWRDVVFVPGGSRALLIANNISGSTRTGRMYAFDSTARTLTENTSAMLTNYGFESLRFAPDGSRAALLAQSLSPTSITNVWFVNAMGARTGLVAARGMVVNTGCNDLAWVRDGFGDPALSVVCGHNTGQIDSLGPLEGTAMFRTVASSGQTGNVHRIASRPQGDMAIAIGSSSSKLYRYQNGVWETGFNSPFARASFGVAFNDIGTRAFAFGGNGYMTEFRYNLYTTTDITTTQIPLSAAPFTQPSSAVLQAVAWRPGCDEGLAVGGTSSVTASSGFVAVFRAANGRRCPNQ